MNNPVAVMEVLHYEWPCRCGHRAKSSFRVEKEDKFIARQKTIKCYFCKQTVKFDDTKKEWVWGEIET